MNLRGWRRMSYLNLMQTEYCTQIMLRALPSRVGEWCSEAKGIEGSSGGESRGVVKK